MSRPASRSGADEFRIFRGLALFGLLVLGLWMMFLARRILFPFVLAALLAYIMNPLATFLELRGLKRFNAVAILYVAVVLIVAGLAWWTFAVWSGELPRLRTQWPGHLQQIQTSAVRADQALRARWPWIAGRLSIPRTAKRFIEKADILVRREPSAYLPYLTNFLLNLVLVPFVGFYMLKGGRAGFQVLLDACPGRWVEKFLGLLYKVDDVIGNYLRGVLFEASVVGLCAGVGLKVIGLETAGLLGAATALLNLIPFVGTLTAGIIAVASAFFQFGNLMAPAWTALLFLSLRLLDDMVIQPFVMNRAVHLHPALIIFAILAGQEIAGVWGLILAVPVVSIVKESATVFLAWYRSENSRSLLPPALARVAEKPWVV
jgi:predicted PurR-regulated permease PerM